MKRIIMIVALSALALACDQSKEATQRSVPQQTISTEPPQGSVGPVAAQEHVDPAIVSSAEAALPPTSVPTSAVIGLDKSKNFTELQKDWPVGEAVQARSKSFLDTGFMKNPSPFGFGDLAYSYIALACEKDERGRISQLQGLFSEIYDSYSFVIPVVQRRVDAISGSRQVNWEDVITRLDEGRWLIQPVSLQEGVPLEVAISDGIDLRRDTAHIRLVKDGSTFTYTETLVLSSGQELPKLSWKIDQYELGAVQEIQSMVTRRSGVPVVLSWKPGSLAGYLVSLPEGEAEYVLRLAWEPSGVLETDRYNFLVLLTQAHGDGLDIRERLGAVDPVWLSLLMYDYVVNP